MNTGINPFETGADVKCAFVDALSDEQVDS